jgi:hypothetical protein
VGINIENVTVDADVTDAGVWNDILSILNDSSISHVCINRHVFNVDTHKSV